MAKNSALFLFFSACMHGRSRELVIFISFLHKHSSQHVAVFLFSVLVIGIAFYNVFQGFGDTPICCNAGAAEPKIFAVPQNRNMHERSDRVVGMQCKSWYSKTDDWLYGRSWQVPPLANQSTTGDTGRPPCPLTLVLLVVHTSLH